MARRNERESVSRTILRGVDRRVRRERQLDGGKFRVNTRQSF